MFQVSSLPIYVAEAQKKEKKRLFFASKPIIGNSPVPTPPFPPKRLPNHPKHGNPKQPEPAIQPLCRFNKTNPVSQSINQSLPMYPPSRLVTTKYTSSIPQLALVSRISIQRPPSLSQPACSSSCANISVLFVDLMQHHGRRNPPSYLRRPHAEVLSTHVVSDRLSSVHEC